MRRAVAARAVAAGRRWICAATRPLLRYHQEMFMPRQDFFLVQLMRGLKVEKRFEPGMGYGIFAREPLHRGELVMYDLPFLSHSTDEMPRNVGAALAGAGESVEAVAAEVRSVLSKLSGDTDEHCGQWLAERGIDVDLAWVTLLAVWARKWCDTKTPNTQVPLSYFSYRDDFRDEDIEARVMVLGYEAICKVVGMDKSQWDIDEFWITFYKYRSNVFRGRLFPVCPTLINHSCWPNATVAEDGALLALRDILPNDQITLPLYGSNCDEVREKGLGGANFKCMTPGCRWSKRVPGDEGQHLPFRDQSADDREWLTPWHASTLQMPQFLLDTDKFTDIMRAPVDKKIARMWETEVTRAGRIIGESPKLPGARRIAAGTGVISRTEAGALVPLPGKEVSIHRDVNEKPLRNTLRLRRSQRPPGAGHGTL